VADRWQTPPQIAKTLGCKPDTVLAWIRSGELVAVNLARRGSTRPRYRIEPRALEAFLAARRVVPSAPTVRRRKRRTEVIEFF
jgi:excisionase family DNA binding protein